MGALDGLKILDFTALLPGPFATMMLADLGADVIKIWNPDHGDLIADWPPKIEGTDTTAVQAWLERNKRSIFLNLKKEESVGIVKKMVSEYDIVIEQFRPGVMDRFGLGYEELRKINPGLIYCSLTGYGQTGPLRDRAGHDCNYLARSGILDAAGRKDSGPSLYNFQIAGVASGSHHAVIGILAAVYHRERTGEGQRIDISMNDGLIPFHSMDGVSYLAGAEAPKREGGQVNGGGIYDFYETADGGYMSVGSLEPKFFAGLCQALGFEQWSDGGEYQKHPQRVKQAFRERFLSRTKEEWTEIFKTYDVCVEPVLTLEEAIRDEQLNQRQMWPEVPLFSKEKRTIRQPGCPIKLSQTPPEYRHAGYPQGYHTEEILKPYRESE